MTTTALGCAETQYEEINLSKRLNFRGNPFSFGAFVMEENFFLLLSLVRSSFFSLAPLYMITA